MKGKDWWLNLKDPILGIPLIKEPKLDLVRNLYLNRNIKSLSVENINWFRYLSGVPPVTSDGCREHLFNGEDYLFITAIPDLIEEYYNLETLGIRGSRVSEERSTGGICPKNIYWERVSNERKEDILNSMKRYSELGMVIPLEWIEELDKLSVNYGKELLWNTMQ